MIIENSASIGVKFTALEKFAKDEAFANGVTKYAEKLAQELAKQVFTAAHGLSTSEVEGMRMEPGSLILRVAVALGHSEDFEDEDNDNPENED